MTEYIKNPLSGKLRGVTYHIVRYVEKINLEDLMPMYGQIGNQIIAPTAVQRWIWRLLMMRKILFKGKAINRDNDYHRTNFRK